jgi:hypothetical protein
MRDDFSPKVINALKERVALRCSNPFCRIVTHGPSSNMEKSINIGVACHITAASIGGPRYDATISNDERKSISNAIWLCQKCAKLIDSDVVRYPTVFINEWKEIAESKALRELGNNIPYDLATDEYCYDNKTLLTYLNEAIDYEFKDENMHDELINHIKECRQDDFISRYPVTGFETPSKLVEMIENKEIEWNIRSVYVDLIAVLRIPNLASYLLDHIKTNYKEINCFSQNSTYRFESAFYSIGAVADASMSPDLYAVSKCILRPSELKFKWDGTAFSHMAFSIIVANCLVKWRHSRTLADFTILKEWVSSFPSNILEHFGWFIENIESHFQRPSQSYSDKEDRRFYMEFKSQILEIA